MDLSSLSADEITNMLFKSMNSKASINASINDREHKEEVKGRADGILFLMAHIIAGIVKEVADYPEIKEKAKKIYKNDTDETIYTSMALSEILDLFQKMCVGCVALDKAYTLVTNVNKEEVDVLFQLLKMNKKDLLKMINELNKHKEDK